MIRTTLILLQRTLYLLIVLRSGVLGVTRGVDSLRQMAEYTAAGWGRFFIAFPGDDGDILRGQARNHILITLCQLFKKNPSAQQCGWLKDKYGASWQIVPSVLPTMLTDHTSEKSQRAMQALLQMKKLDIEKLKQA